MDGKVHLDELPILDRLTFTDTIFMISEGIHRPSEDERIKAVIETLADLFEINYETIAIYSGIKVKELESFMKDANSISYEKRYKLATLSLFLHYLFKKTSTN